MSGPRRFTPGHSGGGMGFISDAAPKLTPEAERKMEEIFNLKHEAVTLLRLIAAEFKTDPTSVQCFDRRTVERSMYVTARLEELDIFSRDSL